MNSTSEQGYLSRASLLIQSHQSNEAASVLRHCLMEYPKSAAAHALLSLCLRDMKLLQEASEHARLAISADPEVSLGHYALSHALLARNRLEPARDAVDEAIQLDPNDADNFALKSQVLFSMKDWAGSLAAAEKGLQLEPEDKICANLRAMALRQLRKGAVAEEAIRTTLSKDPENSLSHANLGWSLLEQGKAKEALSHFQEALRLEPDSEYARDGLIHALRSHYFVYRLLFGYFAWISKFATKYIWIILVGGYFGYLTLSRLANSNPALAPFILPITTAYLVFAITTWLVIPLSNLLLLSNRYGRYALRREQKVTSLIVGICLLLGIVGVVAAFVWEKSVPIQLVSAAIMIGFLALPISGIVFCERGWPRLAAYGIVAVMGLMALLMVGSVIVRFQNGSGIPPQRELTEQEFDAQILQMQLLDEPVQKAQLRELEKQNEIDNSKISDWNRAMRKSWEERLFKAYILIAIISQFAMNGLQMARVQK